MSINELMPFIDAEAYHYPEEDADERLYVDEQVAEIHAGLSEAYVEMTRPEPEHEMFSQALADTYFDLLRFIYNMEVQIRNPSTDFMEGAEVIKSAYARLHTRLSIAAMHHAVGRKDLFDKALCDLAGGLELIAKGANVDLPKEIKEMIGNDRLRVIDGNA